MTFLCHLTKGSPFVKRMEEQLPSPQCVSSIILPNWHENSLHLVLTSFHPLWAKMQTSATVPTLFECIMHERVQSLCRVARFKRKKGIPDTLFYSLPIPEWIERSRDVHLTWVTQMCFNLEGCRPPLPAKCKHDEVQNQRSCWAES